MIERALLIVNSASGTGTGPSLADELAAVLRACGGPLRELEVAVVRNHPAAHLAAASFLAVSDAPAVVIAGGGGGTLRAAVEGIFDAQAPGRVLVGALRMGSGNVLARELGVAQEPHLAMRQLARAFRLGHSTQCPIIRCRFGGAAGDEEVRHAVVMCGLGQWGRTSGDLARWHSRIARGRAAAAALAGLERLNSLEYVAAAGSRLVEAAFQPGACERVEVACGRTVECYRLLAGTVMTTRIGGIPFDPQVARGEAAAGVLLVPRGGRPRRFQLAEGRALHIKLLDRQAVEFFLDEDPEIAHRELSLEIAESISFLEVAA